MKLSEAIRFGAMLKPQGFGFASIGSEVATCAFGAALDAVGVAREYRCFLVAHREWPFIFQGQYRHPVTGYRDSIADIVWTLNDKEHWTRQQIADWVETVEPQAIQIEQNEESLTALLTQ